MQSTNNIFETYNVDLGAYLMLEGIPYQGCRIVSDPEKGEPKALLVFLDEKGVCRDLERNFMMSREKSYRDLNKYLLKDVHKEIKQFNRKLKSQLEE